MQAFILNTVATASNFTRRGRFYNRNLFFSILPQPSFICRGIGIRGHTAQKLIHPNTVVEVAAFLQSVLVHFVGLVSKLFRH